MSDDDPAPAPPSEESGIGTISMLFQSISALMTRCDAVAITLRRHSRHPELFEFTVYETAPAIKPMPRIRDLPIGPAPFPHDAGKP